MRQLLQSDSNGPCTLYPISSKINPSLLLVGSPKVSPNHNDLSWNHPVFSPECALTSTPATCLASCWWSFINLLLKYGWLHVCDYYEVLKEGTQNLQSWLPKALKCLKFEDFVTFPWSTLNGCFLKWWYPKSSILIGMSIINHPFWGTPIFGNTQINLQSPISPISPISRLGIKLILWHHLPFTHAQSCSDCLFPSLVVPQTLQDHFYVWCELRNRSLCRRRCSLQRNVESTKGCVQWQNS